MKVQGFSWAGAPTAELQATARFFHEVLALPSPEVYIENGIVLFNFPNGQLFELFGPGSSGKELMSTPGIAFDVDEIAQARADLQAKAVRFLTDIETASGDDAWCYFEGPDGFLYQICKRALPAETNASAEPLAGAVQPKPDRDVGAILVLGLLGDMRQTLLRQPLVEVIP